MRDLPIPDAVEALLASRLREELKPVEKAAAFRSLMQGQGWTAKRLASELAMSEGQVSRTLSLLELPAVVRERVDRGELPATTAQEIARLVDPREQVRLATAAVEQGFTREDVVKQVGARPKKPRGRKSSTSRIFKYDGYRWEASRASGVDPAEMLASARKVVAELAREVEGQSDAQAA
ncbi:ParB/RepB/Spo0J family partition protein [Paludisphaera soli]|uniref:ParB/RepB/Spo0J family partition protein n=1 Tax=Paludisphaera soli TaxID=2712865 RepID=UPI0013EDF1AE|nr:hypothetical protein [Paludisphaera soli]